MKILIDIGHPAQFNFYTNAIKRLSEEHEILLCYINRGKLPHIVTKEINFNSNVKLFEIGRHRGNKLSIIFEANLFRVLKLITFIYKHKPDIAFGNFYVSAVGAKLFGIPSCQFQDDPEIGKWRMKLMTYFADKVYMPFYTETGNIKTIKTLKEWAYLSPKYFKPDTSVLGKYGLVKKEYIFIREVITSTFNYTEQKKNIIESLSDDFPENIQVILSLEDKSRAEYYPSDWAIIEEPEPNIHSLIFYSKILISSGDSMAREGAQLGVHSIYCGARKMHANEILIKEGLLHHVNPNNVVPLVGEIFVNNLKVDQIKVRSKLERKWDDIVELIVDEVNSIKY